MSRLKPTTQSYSDKDTIQRRDEAVRRALNTPPRPYKESKVGAKKIKAPERGMRKG
jgi:hypothetical protein